MTVSQAGNNFLLSLQDVRVQFGKLLAVRDLSLGLRGGDLLGLIGPNGAGKTTLLRAAAGLQSLTRGSIQILDHRLIAGNPQALRHIGFTPDTPQVYEEMTLGKFLRFIGKGYDIPPREIEERIDFWLEKVWLSEKADQKIKALSRGMRQRVAIARTLLPNPTVILLDEPAAGLDPAGRVQFRQLLCNLREQGKAIIVSSHILADMDEYCTHIAIMAHGAFLQLGTVAQIAQASNGLRCRYSLVLASGVTGLVDIFATFDGVTDVQIDSDLVSFQYSSHRQDAADLLAGLLKQGVPVASFSPNLPSLEEAYLQTGIKQVE